MPGMKRGNFNAMLTEAERMPAYWLERAVLEFTEGVVFQMERHGISRAELARRIGRSPAYVTKILRGTTNFTLETMTRVSQAVGCDLHIEINPRPDQENRSGEQTASAIKADSDGTCNPTSKAN